MPTAGSFSLKHRGIPFTKAGDKILPRAGESNGSAHDFPFRFPALANFIQPNLGNLILFSTPWIVGSSLGLVFG
jgi:hypothetical protein